MLYSVRTRRRLRPSSIGTGEHARAAVTATVIDDLRDPVVEHEIADGTGAMRRPLMTGRIIERVSPRVIATASRR